MNDVRGWLQAAVVWRFLSLVLRTPDEETAAEARGLTRELPEGLRGRAAAMLDLPLNDWEDEYHSVLGPGGCPATESAFDRSTIASRGPLLAEIAAFYEAFAYAGDRAVHEVPDHIAVELGFLAYLAVKVAFALQEGREEETRVTLDAYERFLRTHPAFWVEPFADRLSASGSAFYAGAADLLRETIEAAPSGA